ncbi:MAG: hypothetical protein V4519_03295 [Patescibacteria group bacterium]
MEQDNQNNDKFKSILEKIQKNEITIKPKTYFRLKLIALFVTVTAIVFLSLFLSSLILFTIRVSGQASLIGFGPSGSQVFFHLFPWSWLIVEILLIIILEKLLRSFRFGYKIPVLFLFIGAVVFISASAFVIDKLHMHDEVMRRGPKSFGGVYDRARRPPPPPMGRGIYRGIITSIGTSTLDITIDDRRNASTTSRSVVLPPAFDISDLNPGDRIFIQGEMSDGVINALDVKKAERPLMQ